MDLLTLFTTATADLPSSRTKDIKTAVHYLTRALGYESPETCPQTAYNLPIQAIRRLIEEKNPGKGHSTIRNVKRNLSQLFRLAEAKKLLERPASLMKPRFPRRMRPNRNGSEVTRQTGLYLVRRHWPEPVESAFSDFVKWATGPARPNRLAKEQKRHITMKAYQVTCQGFFGYLHHIKHRPTVKFDDLFNLRLIKEFTYWHIERHGRVTRQIEMDLSHFAVLAGQYRQNEKLRDEIRKLKRTVGRAEPVYDKDESIIPRSQLLEIGQAVWPKKQPGKMDPRRPHTVTAVHAGLSVILQLLHDIPLRQRNIREMRLGQGKNLFQDHTGKWVLRFKGSEMKNKREYRASIAPALVPTLEAYLHTWHPILTAQDPKYADLVFPNQEGHPFTDKNLDRIFTSTIHGFTGKIVTPHLVRTMYATEMARRGVPPDEVAAMLGDKLETVIKYYYYVRTEGVAERLYALEGRGIAA